jgi:hypothetical protein
VGELGWDDLVVADEAGESLRALVGRAAVGGLTLAVAGRAGVGKTFAVRVLAEAMRLDLWCIDCPGLVARHGEAAGSRGLDEVLALGERPHAVILFHDADALLAVDGALDGLVERASVRRAPTVLEARSGDELLARLPPGVERVTLPFPDRALRRALWERLVGRASPLSRIDLDVLAAVEVPGAVIDAAVRAVVLARGDERLETEHLHEAAVRLSV